MTCPEGTGVDITSLFHEVIVRGEGLGMPEFPEKDIAKIERLICERILSADRINVEAVCEALEGFLTTRISFWLSKKGHSDKRVSVWNLEEAKKRLHNSGAPKHTVISLEKQLTNLLGLIREW